MSSVLQSLTACGATCSTVAIRSGSSVLSFHGAWSERYLFASPTTRIASPIACFCRCRAIRSPTVPNAALGRGEQGLVGVGQLARAPGSAPKFLSIIETVRLTRLPQPATSSSLVRRTNSAQVKSVSWFSGPATAMK